MIRVKYYVDVVRCSRCPLHQQTSSDICRLTVRVLGNAGLPRVVSEYVDTIRIVASKHRHVDTDVVR